MARIRITCYPEPGTCHPCPIPTFQILTEPYCLTALLPYCLIALLPYCLTALLPYCPTALLPYCLIALLPHCPIAALPYCPISLPDRLIIDRLSLR
jgi:hypothetical protein